MAPGYFWGGTAISDPRLVKCLAHSGHFPDQSPGFARPPCACLSPTSAVPLSPQQLKGTQDHYEIEGLHVEGQSQESQEGECGDGKVEPRRQRESSPSHPGLPHPGWRSFPAPFSVLPSKEPPHQQQQKQEARGRPGGLQLPAALGSLRLTWPHPITAQAWGARNAQEPLLKVLHWSNGRYRL